jgi:hypothetical protein
MNIQTEHATRTSRRMIMWSSLRTSCPHKPRYQGCPSCHRASNCHSARTETRWRGPLCVNETALKSKNAHSDKGKLAAQGKQLTHGGGARTGHAAIPIEHRALIHARRHSAHDAGEKLRLDRSENREFMRGLHTEGGACIRQYCDTRGVLPRPQIDVFRA